MESFFRAAGTMRLRRAIDARVREAVMTSAHAGAGSVVRLEDGQIHSCGALSGPGELNVVEGAVWITQAGSREDTVLRAGESFAISARGKVLVQALERSVINLAASAADRARS